jgi:hypothetical protein
MERQFLTALANHFSSSEFITYYYVCPQASSNADDPIGVITDFCIAESADLRAAIAAQLGPLQEVSMALLDHRDYRLGVVWSPGQLPHIAGFMPFQNNIVYTCTEVDLAAEFRRRYHRDLPVPELPLPMMSSRSGGIPELNPLS